MVLKKIDNRIRVLIENGIAEGHRTMFVIVGDKSRDQVAILYNMLSKATVRTRASVLWCYKKELGFSSHRKKRMKQLQKKLKSGTLHINEDDPFEMFIAGTNIRYCYYKETHKILGNTFGMCVLQDYEALTPNLLARTIETVEGGGIIVFLLRSMTSLKQLYTMAMDVHSRYRTESHTNVVGRFNERFLLSLASCKKCLIIDDQLTVLPISSHLLNIKRVSNNVNGLSLPQESTELKELKESLQDTQPVGVLVNACKTLDQAKALLKFIDAIAEKSLRSTVSLTAARGRGKSAALGLAITSAVAFSYSNIFVTSPSPENLNTLFEFVFKGFDALDYQEHIDYELVQSTNPEFNKAIIRVNVFRDHRQTIQYIHPSDAHKLGQAELVVIDEAAAIPLPLVKKLLGPYLVFLSSTINGYEGTGRSLSLKLIQQLRQSTTTLGSTNFEDSSKSLASTSTASASGRILNEIQLTESIRYCPGDDIERWLNELLCLDATVVPRIISGCPVPDDCELYYINRDTLFSYHKASEIFLQRLMALYVASHYKNSPNDLQMLSDAPAHHLFCLLGPVDPTKAVLPEILCVIQICLEGKISKLSIMDGLSRGQRASGDLIPWTVAQQFQDQNFPELSGARVVRIATHPDYQRMGYGSRALNLLQQYYSGKIPYLGSEDVSEIVPVEEEEVGILEEQIAPRKSLPPLLLKLSERPAELLDYIGVSFGLTADLLRFWKRSGFMPVYLRQTANDLTGEHSCIMLKLLDFEEKSEDSKWLFEFWQDFRRRFVNLLGFQFSEFHPSLALSVLQNKVFTIESKTMSPEELQYHMTNYDLKRLELYSRNMADYHLIMDLLPTIAKLYFTQKLGTCEMSAVQAAILANLGLQHKTIDDLSKILDRPTTQLLGLFNKLIRRVMQHFNSISENAIAETMVQEKEIVMEPLKETIDEELNEEVQKLEKRQQQLEHLKSLNLAQYSIKGSEDEWHKALSQGAKGIVSMKSSKKRKIVQDDGENFSVLDKIKKKKFKPKKH